MIAKDENNFFDETRVEEIVDLARVIGQNLGLIWNLPKNIENEQTDEHVDRLPVNLADVYFICRKSELLIRELRNSSVWEDSERLRRIVQEIQLQLFEHLEYHYDSLRIGLEAIVKLYPSSETEEELLDSMEKKVDEALSKIRRS